MLLYYTANIWLEHSHALKKRFLLDFDLLDQYVASNARVEAAGNVSIAVEGVCGYKLRQEAAMWGETAGSSGYW